MNYREGESWKAGSRQQGAEEQPAGNGHQDLKAAWGRWSTRERLQEEAGFHPNQPISDDKNPESPHFLY